jgi:monoamine oxidase
MEPGFNSYFAAFQSVALAGAWKILGHLSSQKSGIKRLRFVRYSTIINAIPLLFLCGWVGIAAISVHAQTPDAHRAETTIAKPPFDEASCTPNGKYLSHRYDVIIVGAGIAGLSAAKELQHLNRSVLILEANNRIGGRAYVGYIGHDKVPIDYGGAWIHGIPTNPLTPLVDSMGFRRERTELNLPYFVNGKQAGEDEKKVFDHAVAEYEDAVTLAAKSVEYEKALAEFACSEYKSHVPRKKICRDLERRIPQSRSSVLSDLCQGPVRPREQFCKIADKDLRVTSDVAKDYVPHGREFNDIIPLLIANAGPLESAAELSKTSAVDGAHFEAGEDDLIDKGMGAFVKKLGDGLPVCLNSPVTEVDYSVDGVKVRAGDRVFEGSNALVTVSVGVLKKKKIAFKPELPKEKLEAIDHLQMGNMQKVIVPLNRDIFPKEPKNSWVLYEGDLSGEALDFAKKQDLPLVDGTRVVMAFVIKPLDTNIAIGFFGGDWAKALEKRCDNIEHGSGKSNPKCDDLSIAITKSALSSISGEKTIDQDIEAEGIQVTRWSLDSTSFGAYSVAEPGGWYLREILAEPVEDANGTRRLFFAGEGTARAIYNGSYPGAYESGVKAARDIHATMLEEGEKARKGRTPQLPGFKR